MRLGAHADELAPILRDADAVVFLQRARIAVGRRRASIAALDGRGAAAGSVDELIGPLCAHARAGDHVVFMSNGGFENAPRRLVAALAATPR